MENDKAINKSINLSSCKTLYAASFSFLPSLCTNSWFPFFCCCSKDQTIFLTLAWHCFSLCSLFIFSFLLSDRVWRLSNKPHKDCGFACVVSRGSECISCSVALVGINRLVERMFALFSPSLVVSLTLLYHYKGDKTTVSWEIDEVWFYVKGSKCVCDYNGVFVRTTLNSGHDVFKIY